jgi:hypothetical protein
LLARHHEQREIASCVFLNSGLFPESCRMLLIQKLLLSRLGWLVGRSFGRDDLVRNVTQVYGPAPTPAKARWTTSGA